MISLTVARSTTLTINSLTMNPLGLFLLIFLQVLFFKEINSQYQIIPEHFETLLGDEDQMYENIDLRAKRINRTT